MLERAAHARMVATAKGRRVGRPSVVNPNQLDYARRLRDEGATIAEIVAKTGIARTSLYRHLPPRESDSLTVEPTEGTEEQREAKRAQAAARLIELQRRQADFQHAQLVRQQGTFRPQMICPHCQERGSVRCKAVTSKKGVSGGKATAALLTGGVAMLATGLSRKEAGTQATCENCQSQWMF